MNGALIGELIRLRYKLLWAKTRSRNGRIALFLAGYLILIAAIVLFATGGFGAAVIAVRSGKAELVAKIVLGSIFVEALLASNILGFGLNAIFSDLELRRYPLHAWDRRIARHFIGLAVGLYVAGPGSFWFGLIAVVLLFVSNYILARVIALAIDRIMQRPGGSAVLLVIVMSLAIGPSVLAQAGKNHPEWGDAVARWLTWTPPFAAAAAMIRGGMQAVKGLFVIVAWIAGALALLVRLESLAPIRTAAASTKID